MGAFSLPKPVPFRLPLALLGLALLIGAASELGIVKLIRAPAPLRSASLCAILLGIEFFSASGENVPFVYFKF